MGGRFTLEGQKQGARADQLKYGFADGTKIVLRDKDPKSGLYLALSPLPAERPSSIPKTAQFARNGVYVDCSLKQAGLFQCSVFLAANGEKIADGMYRCNESQRCTSDRDSMTVNPVFIAFGINGPNIGLENAAYLTPVK